MKKYFSFILMFVSTLCSCNVIEEQEPNKVQTELYSYREFKEWYDVGSLEYGTATLTSGNFSYGIFPKDNTFEILEGDMVSYEVEGEMLILETMPQQRSGNYELINIEIKPAKRVNFKVEKEKDTEELIIVNVDDDTNYFTKTDNKVSSVDRFIYDIYETNDTVKTYIITHKWAKSKYMYEGLELYGTVKNNSVYRLYSKDFDESKLSSN